MCWLLPALKTTRSAARARAGRHGPVEQGDDLGLPRRVGRDGLGAAAGLGDRPDDLLDPVRRAAGDEDVMALRGEAPAQCGAQPVLGADADHDCGRPAHDAAPKFVASTILPPMVPTGRTLVAANLATGFSWIGQFISAASRPSAIEIHHMAS